MNYEHIMFFMPVRLAYYFLNIFSLFNTSDQSDNLPSVTYRLIRYFGIRITHDSVREFIKSDPDFPSLKSICNFFEAYGIINYPLRIEKNELSDIDRPFLAHINDNGWKIILVYRINEGAVIFADSLSGKRIMSYQHLIKKWDGVIIITDTESKAEQVDFKARKADEIINKAIISFPFVVLFFSTVYCLLPLTYDLNEKINLLSISIIFSHILGLVFSILLFRNELNLKSSLSEKLCHISTNTDCEAVTKGGVSKIMGSVTWAEIGIVYFSGGLLILSVIDRIEAINLIKILSICSIPYPIFSVLYQWLKIKKWCPFCLMVQLVLMFEFAALILRPGSHVNVSVFMVSSLVFLSILILTVLYKFHIIYKLEKDDYKIKFLKFKRDPDLFLHEFRKAGKIVLPKEDLLLTYGDLRSDIEITAFLSLYCSACSSKFFDILNLIRKESGFKIQLVLPNMKDEVTSKLLKQICFYMGAGNKEESLMLLEKWYKTDINIKQRIFNGLNAIENPAGYDEMIIQNQELFRTGNIQRVPTILVNDFILPQMYTLEELKYHVNEIKQLIEVEMIPISQ